MDAQECNERIEEAFNENRFQDLEYILKTRNCLLKTNVYFAYTFHVLQSAGIFLVALGNALNITAMSWVGMGLNTLASLFQALIHINTKQANKLHEDLVKIKKNKYIDQGTVEYAASGSNPDVQEMLPFNRTQKESPEIADPIRDVVPINRSANAYFPQMTIDERRFQTRAARSYSVAPNETIRVPRNAMGLIEFEEPVHIEDVEINRESDLAHIEKINARIPDEVDLMSQPMRPNATTPKRPLSPVLEVPIEEECKLTTQEYIIPGEEINIEV